MPGWRLHCTCWGVRARGDTLRIRSGEALWSTEYARCIAPCVGRAELWMQALRDNPDCAREEYDALLDADDPGLVARLGYDPSERIEAPFITATGARPRVAILREQGVNGQYEMAAAFDRAGFAAIDVHMSDMQSGGDSTWHFQRHRGLRRLFLRRRAGCRCRLGAHDPVQRIGARAVRARSSRVPTRSRSGSATAAR
jgi:hypothetical protein